jgi:hypothetical protein
MMSQVSSASHDFTWPDGRIFTHGAATRLWLISAALRLTIFGLMIRAPGIVRPKRSAAGKMARKIA